MIPLLVILLVGAAGYGLYHVTGVLAFAATVGVWVSAALIVGTPFFWLLMAIECGVLFWCLDDESDDYGSGIAGVSLVVIALLFQFFSPVKPFTYLWQHVWQAVLAVAGYLVVGSLWSVIKWWFVETSRFNRVKDDFFQFNNLKGQTIPDEYRERWNNKVAKVKSDPRQSKARFISWIAYWPWSLVWTLVNDPLKRAVRRIYTELLSTYQRITDHVWKEA